MMKLGSSSGWASSEICGVGVMPKYKVAHIREQGQDMIIFPLATSFAQKTESDQNEELGVLEFRANGAGLRGVAVAVWDAGSGRMGFRGPTQWHPFAASTFNSFSLISIKRFPGRPSLFHGLRIFLCDGVPALWHLTDAIADTGG
jgi:hypothetical protein